MQATDVREPHSRECETHARASRRDRAQPLGLLVGLGCKPPRLDVRGTRAPSAVGSEVSRAVSCAVEGLFPCAALTQERGVLVALALARAASRRASLNLDG